MIINTLRNNISTVHSINYRQNWPSIDKSFNVWKNYNYWFTSSNAFLLQRPATSLITKKKKRDGTKKSKKGKGKYKLSAKSSRNLVNRIGNFRGFYSANNKNDDILFLTYNIPSKNITRAVKRYFLNKLLLSLSPEYYVSRSELRPSNANLHFHIIAANTNSIVSLEKWYKWLRSKSIVPNSSIKSLKDASNLANNKKIPKKEFNRVCNYITKNPDRKINKEGKEQVRRQFMINGHQWSSSRNLSFGPLVTTISATELIQLMNGHRKVYSINNSDGNNIGTTICNTPISDDLLSWYKFKRFFN